MAIYSEFLLKGFNEFAEITSNIIVKVFPIWIDFYPCSLKMGYLILSKFNAVEEEDMSLIYS